VLYHVVILSGDGDTAVVTHVLVNAIDGSIVKSEREERRREGNPESGWTSPGNSEYSTTRKTINGGDLGMKALSLPRPEYPVAAMGAHAEGEVIVQIAVDETGRVVSARPLEGHPLLRDAAVSAARKAVFSPTRLNGEPVVVTGVLSYKFVAQ
jgi:TonB family protein